MGGIGSIFGDVDARVEAYRGNPQALMQQYAQSQQLVDLLALQKIKSEKEAAARQLQAQMQTTPGTIAEQREQEVMDMTRQEVASTMGAGLQALPAGNMDAMRTAQGGIMPPTSSAPPPVSGESVGGQSKFAEGGAVRFNKGGSTRMRRDVEDGLGALIARLLRMKDRQPVRPDLSGRSPLDVAATPAPGATVTMPEGAYGPPGRSPVMEYLFTGVPNETPSPPLPEPTAPTPAPETVQTAVGLPALLRSQPAPGATGPEKPTPQQWLMSQGRPKGGIQDLAQATQQPAESEFDRLRAQMEKELAPHEDTRMRVLADFLLNARGNTLGGTLGAGGRGVQAGAAQRGATRQGILAKTMEQQRLAEQAAQEASYRQGMLGQGERELNLKAEELADRRQYYADQTVVALAELSAGKPIPPEKLREIWLDIRDNDPYIQEKRAAIEAEFKNQRRFKGPGGEAALRQAVEAELAKDINSILQAQISIGRTPPASGDGEEAVIDLGSFQ